ncbi:hypothetical protein D3C75_1157920 [compost metagenome]
MSDQCIFVAVENLWNVAEIVSNIENYTHCLSSDFCQTDDRGREPLDSKPTIRVDAVSASNNIHAHNQHFRSTTVQSYEVANFNHYLLQQMSWTSINNLAARS